MCPLLFVTALLPASSTTRRVASVCRHPLKATATPTPSSSAPLPAQSPSAIPSSAISALLQTYTSKNAVIHRGSCAHTLGRLAADSLQEARRRVAKYIHAAVEEEIVFASNAVAAMSYVSRAFCKSFPQRSEIILTQPLHDVVQSVWHMAAKEHRIKVQTTADASFMSVAARITPRTKAIVMMSGQRDEEVATFAREMGVVVIVDGTQSIATGMDVQGMKIDVLVVDGAVVGAPGGAFWYGRREILTDLPPVIGSENALEEVMLDKPMLDRRNWAPVPERFESGMVSLPQVVALVSALEETVS